MPGGSLRSSRSLAARQRVSSATNYTSDDKILPPLWGKLLHRFLCDSNLSVDAQLTNIKTEIQTSTDTASEALSLAKANDRLVNI